MPDVKKNGGSWVYSDVVKEHFFKPRNFVKTRQPRWDFNGYGESGSAACGDVMKIWLYVDPLSSRIKKMGWKTFGCASAIATTSILSEMVTKDRGMLVETAYQIKPQDIIVQLSGLPTRKVHCSVLGDRALRSAIDNFRKKCSNTVYHNRTTSGNRIQPARK